MFIPYHTINIFNNIIWKNFPYGQKYYEDQLDNPFNIIKVEFEEYFPTIYKYFKEYFLMNGNIWKTISMWTERLGRSS